MTTTPTELAQKMREAAATIREANKAYDYNVDYGMWSPVELLKEAGIVETADEL